MLAFVLLVFLDAGRARAEDKPRVLWLCAHEDSLEARVLGQTRDLPIEWLASDECPAEDAAALVRAWGQRQRVELVAWAQAEAGGYDVQVLRVRDGLVRARRVPAAREGEELAHSATLEATALVVRAELVSFLEEPAEPLAPHASPYARQDGGPPEGMPPEALPPARSVDPLEQSRPRTLRLTLRAGYELSRFHAEAWAHAVQGRVGFSHARLELGLGASFGFPSPFEDARARVASSRHALFAYALATLFQTRALSLDAGGSAGAFVFSRTTRWVAPGLEPAPDDGQWSPQLGAELQLRFSPWERFGLALGLGLDVVPLVPRYVYAHGASRSERLQVFFLQPRTSVLLRGVL